MKKKKLTSITGLHVNKNGVCFLRLTADLIEVYFQADSETKWEEDFATEEEILNRFRVETLEDVEIQHLMNKTGLAKAATTVDAAPVPKKAEPKMRQRLNIITRTRPNSEDKDITWSSKVERLPTDNWKEYFQAYEIQKGKYKGRKVTEMTSTEELGWCLWYYHSRLGGGKLTKKADVLFRVVKWYLWTKKVNLGSKTLEFKGATPAKPAKAVTPVPGGPCSLFDAEALTSGTFVFRIGKYKGKDIAELKAEEVVGYLTWFSSVTENATSRANCKTVLDLLKPAAK